MVFDVRQETGDQPEAIKRVADELGVPPNMLWQWVERAARSESSDETPTADPDAYESGMQLVEFGALDEAQTLWRAAAEAGNTDAATGLGRLLVQRGDLAEAETWWRTAAEAGNTAAANSLGQLLVQRGDLDEAATWWRAAAEAGDTTTAAGVGVLLEQRGDLDEAASWYRTAAEAGNTAAAGARRARRGRELVPHRRRGRQHHRRLQPRPAAQATR